MNMVNQYAGGHYLTTWIRGKEFKITKCIFSEALDVPLVRRSTFPESYPIDDVTSLLCGRLITWGLNQE